MKKPPRVQITPKGAFLEVEPQLRKKFAEEAVEVVMAEGRHQEIVNRIITKITGLTQPALTSEVATVKTVKTTRQNKQNTNTLPIKPTVLEPAPGTAFDNCVKILQDPKSIPSSILSIVKMYGGKVELIELVEELYVSYRYDDTDGRLDTLLQMLCVNGHISVDGEGDGRSICLI